MKLTKLQREVLAHVSVATVRGQWYRAASSGQRVTLASLFYKRILQRRAWRGLEGEADAAHEYKLTDEALKIFRSVHPTVGMADKDNSNG